MDIPILIVDDMASMRGLIKATLKQAGYQNLEEAPDGESAMGMLARNQYGFVICDWDMPKANGLEVLEFVRQDRQLLDLPFIMLTANAARDQVLKAIELGVTDYISKPFKPETLLSKLTQHL